MQTSYELKTEKCEATGRTVVTAEKDGKKLCMDSLLCKNKCDKFADGGVLSVSDKA